MLAGADVIEAPELQALYDWCLQQEWDATPDKLEEYGPVLALGVGFGEEISKHTGMRWVWVERDEFGWFGPALIWPGKQIFAHPTRMLAGRLYDRNKIRIDALIDNLVRDLGAVAKAQSSSGLTR